MLLQQKPHVDIFAIDLSIRLWHLYLQAFDINYPAQGSPAVAVQAETLLRYNFVLQNCMNVNVTLPAQLLSGMYCSCLISACLTQTLVLSSTFAWSLQHQSMFTGPVLPVRSFLAMTVRKVKEPLGICLSMQRYSSLLFWAPGSSWASMTYHSTFDGRKLIAWKDSDIRSL